MKNQGGKYKFPQPFHLRRKDELEKLLKSSNSEVSKYIANSPYVKDFDMPIYNFDNIGEKL